MSLLGLNPKSTQKNIFPVQACELLARDQLWRGINIYWSHLRGHAQHAKRNRNILPDRNLLLARYNGLKNFKCILSR